MIENTHKVSLGVYLIEHMTSWIAKLINLQEEFTDYFLWIWFYFDIAAMGQIWCRYATIIIIVTIDLACIMGQCIQVN